MDIIRTIQHAWYYLTNNEYKREHNEEIYRKQLIRTALDSNPLFKMLDVDITAQGEVLIQILNEISKSITSSVLNKTTRKYQLLDLIETDEVRISNYTNIINTVCIECIRTRMVDNEILNNQHTSQSHQQQLHQLLTNAVSMFDVTTPISEFELNCKITSKSFNELEALGQYVLSIQPLTGPVGLGWLMSYKHEPHPQINIERYAVVAKSRKLQARYNIEPLADISHCNQNMLAEIVSIVGQEVGHEISNELVQDIYGIASQHNKIDIDNVSAFDGACCNLIRDIAKQNRRGKPTFVMVNELGLDLLRDTYDGFSYTTNLSESSVISFVGNVTIDNTEINVLLSKVDKFHYSSMPIALFGYKGKTQQIDVGMCYHPYHMCIPRVAIDVQTFQPTISLTTRYETSAHIGDPLFDNSKHYFGVIEGPSI